jgi:hypothetical protein
MKAASKMPETTGNVAAKATTTTEEKAEAALFAWRQAVEKVQSLRAAQVSRSGYPNGNTLIESYGREADLFEAEAERCRLEAEATIALEALDFERKDELAIAMSPSLLREFIAPDVARIAELRAEISRIEQSIVNARVTSHEAYAKASARRAAEGLPGVRGSIARSAIEYAPTLEALLVEYEEASADPKHGLSTLEVARAFDLKAETARKKENNLRIEREQLRREEAERKTGEQRARESQARAAKNEAEQRAAEAKRTAESEAQIAKHRADLLAADRKRETAERAPVALAPVAPVAPETSPIASELAVMVDLSSSPSRGARI